MIKNIIFDMGAVIIDYDPIRFLQRYDISEEDRQLIYRKMYRSYQWQLMDMGYYENVSAFMQDMKGVIPERLMKVAADAAEFWCKPEIKPIEGTVDLIKELSDKGYNLYLLSNAGPNHPAYWPMVHGHEYFKNILVSYKEQKYKPCKDIYQAALKKFGIKAEESVFIDDLPINCAGAFLCGITPIVFENAQQTKDDLKVLGLL